MRIAEIIEKIRAVAAPWAQEHGGTICVAKDPWHAYEIVAAGPRGLLVVIAYPGETVVDSPRGNPIAQMRVEVTLANGLDLGADTGAGTFRQIGDRASLVDLIEDLKAACMAVDFSGDSNGTTEPSLSYTGTDTLELANGIRMAAYRLNFSIARVVLSNPRAV